jgi:hypothetical protein
MLLIERVRDFLTVYSTRNFANKLLGPRGQERYLPQLCVGYGAVLVHVVQRISKYILFFFQTSLVNLEPHSYLFDHRIVGDISRQVAAELSRLYLHCVAAKGF